LFNETRRVRWEFAPESGSLQAKPIVYDFNIEIFRRPMNAATAQLGILRNMVANK
jgi:hypothetical protein